MGDYVVHGPLSAERWHLPAVIVEVFKVVDEARTLRVHQRPDISHELSSAQVTARPTGESHGAAEIHRSFATGREPGT
jgi:hypothetical protein